MHRIFLVGVLATIFFAAHSQEYDLKLKLKKGQRIDNKTDITMDISAGNAGQGNDMVISMTFELSQKVKAISIEGNYVIESEYSRMIMGMKMPNGRMRYDSNDKKDTGEVQKRFEAYLGGMLGRKFELTLTPEGKVIDIKGLKEIVEAITKGKTDSTAKQLLENWLGGDKVKYNFESYYDIYPVKPVKAGDTWTQAGKVENTIGAQFSPSYVINSVTKGVATIVSGCEMMINRRALESHGFKSDVDYTGNYTGIHQVDLKTGLPVNTFMVTLLKGNFEIKEKELPLTMKITQSNSITMGK
jgi:hypothetical protein